MGNRVVIVGAGGMGRETLAWLAASSSPGIEFAGFLDDELPLGTEVAGSTVVGSVSDVAEFADSAVVAIGSPRSRREVTARLEGAGVALATIVHPSAVLGPNVEVGDGCIVGPNVTITRDALIGRSTIVNFGAQIGHDARIGDHVFIGPGVVLGGGVEVGAGAEVGMNASVLPSCCVGADARVGAGAVVTRDVRPAVTVVGIPARETSQ